MNSVQLHVGTDQYILTSIYSHSRFGDWSSLMNLLSYKVFCACVV